MNLARPLRHFLLALLLACGVFAVFSSTLRFGLIALDDLGYISSNPLVLEEINLIRVRAAFTTFQQGMYAPLLWLSYGLDAALLNASPSAPGGFHFTNVLLHSLNSALLFFLLLAMDRKPWPAIFLAAL